MGMIQCENCYCTLYFTGEDGPSGFTGELCYECERELEYDDWDDDDC